jgi:lysyl-tRNA synthetase class 2
VPPTQTTHVDGSPAEAPRRSLGPRRAGGAVPPPAARTEPATCFSTKAILWQANSVDLRTALRIRKRANDVTRAFFDARGFLEVETPIVVPSPGLEPHLFAFETELVDAGGRTKTRYLHTSPEYAMKKLLGAGSGSIYQLARVFRNGEQSDLHVPEFTMLEWYRQPGELDQLMDDVSALVEALRAELAPETSPFSTRRCDMAEAFSKAGLPDPLECTTAADLARAAEVRAAPDDTWEDVFFRAFLERVEPTFEPDELVLVEGWPASMAALAELDSADPRRARRFEAYLGGVEVANAFQELTDPQEQRRRFEAERAERRARGRPAPPIDEALLAALPSMGRTAGIALGLERVVMKLVGAPTVAAVGVTIADSLQLPEGPGQR